MKASIHPTYYKEAKASCACGNTFITGATKPEIKVEICSKCHPFFTGEMKFVDSMGRVEKFQTKQKYAKTQISILADKKKKKQQKQNEIKSQKSLKEMLSNLH